MDVISLKGKIGEGRVVQELNKLSRKDYYMLNDILIEHKGYYAQIDHVVLSKKAIYLIETKNWSGKLYGDQYSEHWKQYIWGSEYKQQNPVKQAWLHKRKFLEVFRGQIGQLEVKSIVVFLENIDITNVTTETRVLKINELVSYIENDEGHSYTTDEEAVVQLFKKLNEMNILDVAKREEHIQNISHKKESNNMIDIAGLKNGVTIVPSKLNNQEVKNKEVKNQEKVQHYYANDLKAIAPCSVWKRIAAAIIDFFLLILPFIYLGDNPDSNNRAIITLLVLFLVLGLQVKYWTRGQGIGKKIMKVQVINVKTQEPTKLFKMLLREFVGRLTLNIFTYGGPLATIFFTEKKQCLHDIIFKTIVVDE